MNPTTEEVASLLREQLGEAFDIKVSPIAATGKTKILCGNRNAGGAYVYSTDDITAGDGKLHEVLPNKGIWSTRTTSNVFSLLKTTGIPVAFHERVSDRVFTAPLCDMIPLEVIARREAHGSYRKRNPHVPPRHVFPKLMFELFLKTKDKVWKGQSLPCDDPLMQLVDGGEFADLYIPSQPLWTQQPFMRIPISDIFGTADNVSLIKKIEELTRKTFLTLEKAWQLLGEHLADFKIEFGWTSTGPICVADVIDSDSWRKVRNGAYTDKQIVRDGGKDKMGELAEKYQQTAALSDRFHIPKQRLIIWRASSSDNVDRLIEATQVAGQSIETIIVGESAHKKPVHCYQKLHQLLQEIPDSVVIALVGRSNGLGPTLAANCTNPVITVPANGKEFPEDVWSSLRAPSNNPVLTVLDPANAVLAALQILAMRNPALYANLRYEVEERLMNVVELQ